jgi:hypothetical protein
MAKASPEKTRASLEEIETEKWLDKMDTAHFEVNQE